MDAYVGTYQGNLEGLGNVVTTRRAHRARAATCTSSRGLAPPNQFERAQREFSASIRSFQELSREEAADIRPNRIDLYTVRSGDTWQSIAQRTGEGTLKPSTLAIMNDYEPSQQPRAGDRIKVVVAGLTRPDRVCIIAYAQNRPGHPGRCSPPGLRVSRIST